MSGPEAYDAAQTSESVLFVEYGTHKTILFGRPGAPSSAVSGQLRVSDQAIIDALRDAFEKLGWDMVDRVG